MRDFDEIRRSVRSLCAAFPGEYWRTLDIERSYPTEFVSILTQAGFLAALIPESYGGSGLPLSAACAILEEINSQGCNSAACHAQMYTMGTILRHGSTEQKERILPSLANGSLRLQAFAVTEPSSGTDTASISTFARHDSRCYIISGQKIFTSRAEHSDLLLLLARTTSKDEVSKRTDGLSIFLIDMRQALGNGLTLKPIRTMMNHATCEMFIDDLRVPERDLVGEEGKGFRYVLDSMNAERILISAESIGDARWFIEKAVNYANIRVVFGHSIGSYQGIQFPIARSYIAMKAAILMTQKAAALFDANNSCGAEANMAKLLASEAACQAADVCMQTHGGYGFAEQLDIERKFRETRLYQVAPVSTNMILSYIGEHVLHLPKSY